MQLRRKLKNLGVKVEDPPKNRSRESLLGKKSEPNFFSFEPTPRAKPLDELVANEDME